MSGAAIQRFTSTKADLEREHISKLRKTKRNHKRELDELNGKNQSRIENIKKDYDIKITEEKGKLQRDLTSIRNKNEKKVKNEGRRYEQILKELKSANGDKLSEVQKSQKNERETTKDSHRRYIENADRKFKLEKSKYDV